jgi:hypothetical protein
VEGRKRRENGWLHGTLIYYLFFVVVVLGPFGVIVAGYIYQAYEQTNLCGL